MITFTIELVSVAFAQLCPENTPSSSTKFLPEQLSLENCWAVVFSELSYTSAYQSITEVSSCFLTKKTFKLVKKFYLDPGLYHSNIIFVEAMITTEREKHIHTETSIAVKMSFTSQIEDLIFYFFSTDVGHIFQRRFGNEVGLMLRGN